MNGSSGGPFTEPGFTRVGLKPRPPEIVDQYGKSIWGSAYELPRDPVRDADKDMLARVVVRDLPLITTMTGNWTLPLIKTALADHMRGLFNLPGELADEISGDDRVQATIGSRTGGLYSQPLEHRGGSRRFRQWWRKAWKRLLPQSVASEIMTWAVLLGFCVCEILWDATVTPWQPYLKVWHPKFIWYRTERREYWAITMDGIVPVIPGTGKWLLFTPHGPYRGWVRGVIRSIAEKWFIKALAWRDWARFNERHGLPVFKAIIPAAGDILQKQAFIQSLSRLGQEAVLGLPQNVDGSGYDAELLEARDRSWESFKGTIDRCDMSIVLPILWQNLTTEVKEGSLAAAREHGDIRQNALEFDNATMSEAVHNQVARVAAFVNFGDPDEACMTRWRVTPIEDYAAKADTFLKFGQAMNYLRQSGFKPTDMAEMGRQCGIDVDATEVDPTQVEARQAGATGKVEEQPTDDAAPDDGQKAMQELTASLSRVSRLARGVR